MNKVSFVVKRKRGFIFIIIKQKNGVTTFFVIFSEKVLTTFFVNDILCLTRKVVNLQIKDVKLQIKSVNGVLYKENRDDYL